MKLPVYNMEGVRVSETELPKAILDARANVDLLHQVAVMMHGNRRAGTAHAKDRSEVSGGGRKPWKQKGTGRARHGSIRSPIWIGGGVTHGPRNEKVYTRCIPKRMAKGALFGVLKQKAKDGELIVLDALTFPAGKTKDGAAFLKRLATSGAVKPKSSALVLTGTKDASAERALRNIPMVDVTESRNINAFSALEHRYVLLTTDALYGLV